jgi:hypothetical protein
MAGHTPGLIKGYKAEAAVTKRRIVKPGTADGNVVPAAAVGDALMGVSTEIDSAIGESCDVIKSGLADVEYGGAVTRGDWLTSDASGRAVAAAPAAAANANVIGRAEVSGVLGDIGVVFIAPGRIQG